MQQARYTYRNSVRGITTLLLILLAMHFSGLQGIAESNLEDSSVRVEKTSEVAFTSPAQPEMSSQLSQGYTITPQEKAHNSISSLLFLSEEESGEFDKKRMLQFNSGILTFLTASSSCRGASLAASAFDFIQTFANTHLLTVVLLH